MQFTLNQLAGQWMKNIFSFFNSDQGNVVIEFTVTAVALFIPISYVAFAATAISTNYIAVQDAARSAARIFATSSTELEGRAKAEQIVNDQLGASPDLTIKLSCSHNPCLVAEEIVKVEVIKVINLNLPGFFGYDTVTVTGVQAEVVEESQ